MFNAQKHDSGASEGARTATEDAPESSATPVSPSSNQPYGVARVTSVWNLARSSFYAARRRQLHPQEAKKRGPKAHSDEELVGEIRQLLAEPIFTGEGYRKIWARLRHKVVPSSKDRVLPLLREHQLLSPARRPDPARHNPHEGAIVTEAPNQMWGADATATFTDAEGAVTVFAAIDHCMAESVGIHAVKKATRFEALEPIRQGVREVLHRLRGRQRRRREATSRSRKCLPER